MHTIAAINLSTFNSGPAGCSYAAGRACSQLLSCKPYFCEAQAEHLLWHFVPAFILPLNQQSHSLPGEEGEGLEDSDDSLVFLEERFEEDNVWLEEHLDADESVKNAHFNIGPYFKYLTEKHAKAMKGATDPWSNPVLLSYL